MRLRIVTPDTPDERPEEPETLMGYTVARVLHGDQPGRLAYTLSAGTARYRLIRHVTNHRRMYVLNNRGAIASIKGHYAFTDERGILEPIS